MTALLFVHGRAQEMPAHLGRSDGAVRGWVAEKKRAWLAGLAKGLVLAGQAPVAAKDVYFPFYGNTLVDLITAHETSGGRSPELEAAPVSDAATATTEELLLDTAAELGFDAPRRLERTDPELAAEVREVDRLRAEGLEAGLSDILRARVLREALQFVSDKTGTAAWIVERWLRDVAYYLEDSSMRKAVQGEVRAAVDRAVADGHEDLVVVGHSLGSVVTYDTCASFDAPIAVRLLVTAGSPLGQTVVRKNLLGGPEGSPDRAVPAVIAPRPGRDRPHWLNVYDVRDVVALVHPLAARFSGGATKIRDERTHNPSDPHSVEDYLADPDVAGPIGDAVRGP